jgi:transposase
VAGKSRVTAGDQQRNALLTLAHSRDRGEADRARAILLTLSGWTSPRIAEAFSVREDTVRLWRSEFARGGVEALKATVAPGPPPVKTEAALRVVAPLLEAPVADRPNWTIPRLMAEIEAREGVKIGKSQLSKALRKKTSVGGAPGTRCKAARLPPRSNAWDCAFNCARLRPKPATSSSSTATRARP